ncbi:MAG: DUF998 domain-containing protein [Planctomycetota bacterium]|jgi:hypothetical protein
MDSFLLRQARVVPLIMIAPILLGLAVDDYDSLTQHMSELELRAGAVSWVVRISAFLAGASIFGFGLALMLDGRRVRFAATPWIAAAFGVGMMSNGVFIIGNPLHGLYGLPIFSVLVPAAFSAEYRETWGLSRGFVRFSCWFAVLNLLYMWGLLAGFDPEAYRGLTQRAATVVMFGWFAFVPRSA